MSGAGVPLGGSVQAAMLTLKPLGARLGTPASAGRLQHAPLGVLRLFTRVCPSRDAEAFRGARRGSPGWGWAPPTWPGAPRSSESLGAPLSPTCKPNLPGQLPGRDNTRAPSHTGTCWAGPGYRNRAQKGTEGDRAQTEAT